MNNLPRCGECKFWRPKDNKNKGECKVDGPKLDHRGYGCWPLTEKGEFCYKGVHVDIPTMLTEQDINDLTGPPDYPNKNKLI